jgi:hypothetical protein
MSWSFDTRCSQCIDKSICPDRPVLYGTLSPLQNKLNTDPAHQDPTPGNGIIIINCADFSMTPRP